MSKRMSEYYNNRGFARTIDWDEERKSKILARWHVLAGRKGGFAHSISFADLDDITKGPFSELQDLLRGDLSPKEEMERQLRIEARSDARELDRVRNLYERVSSLV
ncbi:unnamed protein product, partial [marine sediment metagenome]